MALTSEGKFDSKATKKRTAKDECKSDKIISGKKQRMIPSSVREIKDLGDFSI